MSSWNKISLKSIQGFIYELLHVYSLSRFLPDIEFVGNNELSGVRYVIGFRCTFLLI